MRVIDGTHRLQAARLRGASSIAVRYFDGTNEQAFILAVHLNVTHGKPLTLKDRKAAATRILCTHCEWSDRRIAAAAGLSHRTVAALRSCSSVQNNHMDGRVGKDGRTRRLTTEDGRQRAAEVIQANPDASVRVIARLAEISTGTAAEVKRRLARGMDPVLPNVTTSKAMSRTTAVGGVAKQSASQSAAVHAIQRLQAHPATRSTNNGRSLYRLVVASLRASERCEKVAEKAPASYKAAIAEVALGISDVWRNFALHLKEGEQRAV
jgi:hypothetical protein